MTPRTLFTAAAVAFTMLVGSQPAYAQGNYEFKVPFSFVANGKTLAAGQYFLSVDNAQNVVTLTSKAAKGGGVFMPVETRISSRASSLTEPEVVFDKLNGQLYVSELLVPGDDGYLMLVTKATHSHEQLKGSRASK